MIFGNTNINITTTGRCYLGALLGCAAFRQGFRQTKVNYWIDQIEKLALIAKSQPLPAYSAIIHGLQGRWIYALWSSQVTSETLEPLEASIRDTLIPALTGCSSPRDDIGHLMALPAWLGGLEIPNPTSMVTEFSYSEKITAPLVERTIPQQFDQFEVSHQQNSIKMNIQRLKQQATKANAE